jgi:quercetin dioxygenase-like cupin family protein
MRLEAFPSEAVDWDNLTPLMHQGEKGYALSRTMEAGEARVRKIDYSPGYLADHWCEKGHIILVLEGEIDLQLKDGPTETLRAGMSYHIADNAEPHKAHSSPGAVLFIVD